MLKQIKHKLRNHVYMVENPNLNIHSIWKIAIDLHCLIINYGKFCGSVTVTKLTG